MGTGKGKHHCQPPSEESSLFYEIKYLVEILKIELDFLFVLLDVLISRISSLRSPQEPTTGERFPLSSLVSVSPEPIFPEISNKDNS